MGRRPWIAVDLDGTLAHYDGWKGIEHIGEPVPLMLRRVKAWIAEGKEVRIFTARVSRAFEDAVLAALHVMDWCEKHVGVRLQVTCEKDFDMIEIWDDRAIPVQKNRGVIDEIGPDKHELAYLDEIIDKDE
jgi:hypothetical protein